MSAKWNVWDCEGGSDRDVESILYIGLRDLYCFPIGMSNAKMAGRVARMEAMTNAELSLESQDAKEIVHLVNQSTDGKVP